MRCRPLPPADLTPFPPTVNFLRLSDGARWVSDIAGAAYLKAAYQLDWWRYEKKLRAALPSEVKLQQELMNLLREGKGGDITGY